MGGRGHCGVPVRGRSGIPRRQRRQHHRFRQCAGRGRGRSVVLLPHGLHDDPCQPAPGFLSGGTGRHGVFHHPAGGGRGHRYSVIDSGSGETPLAQAEFSYQQSSYTLRALKSGAEEDISGLYADWAVAMDWRMGQLSIRYNESDGTGWIGWYDGETQWCLSAVEEADAPLVDTACPRYGSAGL